MSEAKGPISDMIGELRDGKNVNAAARGIWDRYFGELVPLARSGPAISPSEPAVPRMSH